MTTDHNEAMRPNMNDRSEREFMGRMESNHAKLTEFSHVVGSFTQDYQRLYATYTSYREMLRAVITERDQLRAEVERLRVDAERYEWLRDCHPADKSLWVAMGLPHAPGGVSCWRNDELDTAIDTARKATQ